MEFRLLGPLEVVDAGTPIPIGGGKRRALLALLLVHRNEVVPAERLIEELWAARPPPTAAKSLQVHVSQLRKDLATDGSAAGTRLLTRSGGYVLEVGPADLDVACFERALTEGEEALADGDAADAAVRLSAALELWRGPALVDFAYDAFAQDEIARLDELRLVALEERIDADLALGRHEKVVAELEALVRAHPVRERLRGQLMLALYRCGRRGDALEAYREGRRRSVDELGLEPGPPLRSLEGQILADDPALAPPPRARAGRPRRSRAPVALVVAGVLVAGAALAVALRADRGSSGSPAELQIGPNAVVGLASADARPRFAIPLSGRPTDLAAQGDRVFAVSIDSSALTIVDGVTNRLSRTVPLAMRPAAVAVAGDAVWVVDGRRGLVVRLAAGYEHVDARLRWARAPRREAVGLSRADPTGIALAAGSAWVTDGTSRLVRVDAADRVTRPATPHPLDGIAAGAGAVWAISTRDAAVVRIDPRTARVTDDVRLAERPGSDAAAPIAIAATRSAVWVLNGNTATVSRIDALTRAVTATVRLPADHAPRDLDAAGDVVWVAGFDGSVTRIPSGAGAPRTTFVGTSLTGVAAAPRHVWLAAAALDQQIPGGQ